MALTVFLSGCYNKNNPDDTAPVAKDASSIIFFYGQECPHCHDVKKYFEENKTHEKVEFSEREVYHDQANANLMLEKASVCGLDKGKLGVPFLWAEGKCLMGEQPIEDFFNAKINAK